MDLLARPASRRRKADYLFPVACTTVSTKQSGWPRLCNPNLGAVLVHLKRWASAVISKYIFPHGISQTQISGPADNFVSSDLTRRQGWLVGWWIAFLRFFTPHTHHIFRSGLPHTKWKIRSNSASLLRSLNPPQSCALLF